MIDKGLERRPRDILVSKRPDGKRPGYGRWDDPGMSPGTSPSGGGRGGPPGGGDPGMTYSAPPVAYSPPPVTTAKAPPSILSRPTPTVTTAPITRDVIPVAPTITKRPTEMLDIAGDIKAQEKLQEDIRESQRTGAYAEELGLPPKTIPGPLEQFLPKPKLKEIVNLGDDAKAKHIQTVQKQAVVDWNNKTEREREEHREKLQTAQEKLKTTKGGSFWKTLGNIAMAMFLPALLPAKFAKGYNLYKTAKTASTWAKRLNLTDRDIMQIVQQDIFKGVDIQKAIAGKETEFAKSVAKFSGEGADSNKEYTEKTIGKVQTVKDVEPTGQITNEERQKYQSQLEYMQGILQSGYYTNRQGETIQLTDDHRRQLSDYMNQLNTYLNPTTQGIAHGGRIDQPLTGRSRYI